MSERELADQQRVLDSWKTRIPQTPQRSFEMQHGLATKEQIAEAKQNIQWAKGDPEFGRKVITPGLYAKEKEAWNAWHFVAYACREAPPDYDWSKGHA